MKTYRVEYSRGIMFGWNWERLLDHRGEPYYILARDPAEALKVAAEIDPDLRELAGPQYRVCEVDKSFRLKGEWVESKAPWRKD